MSSLARRRVVVTGLGAVTPLGNSFAETWSRLLQGHSGVTTLTDALQMQHYQTDGTFDNQALEQDLELAQHLSCQVAAPVRNITSDPKTPRFVQFALMAAQQALDQSRLVSDESDHDDSIGNTSRRLHTGVSIGSGMSSVRQIVAASRLPAIRKLSPHFVPSVLQNSASARVSMAHSLGGPNLSASTACAASSHAIGDAYLYIKAGMADVMLAGGTESSIDPLSLAGFSRLRALSTNYNDMPSRASRPFDASRDGFVMAQGAAVLVLEELEHALQRQAPNILAELVGFGASADANHITSPDPQGRGALRAMQMALRMANLQDEDVTSRVDYVNAHATSTPVGDDIEAKVLCDLFHSDASPYQQPPFVSSTKGATGHLLGAAGALEAAFTVQALVNQTIPATLNLETTTDNDKECSGRLRHVMTAQSHELQVAMSNSFGFGGTNASLVFRKWNNDL